VEFVNFDDASAIGECSIGNAIISRYEASAGGKREKASTAEAGWRGHERSEREEELDWASEASTRAGEARRRRAGSWASEASTRAGEASAKKSWILGERSEHKGWPSKAKKSWIPQGLAKQGEENWILGWRSKAKKSWIPSRSWILGSPGFARAKGR
jgi:hypothetical protein